MKTQTEADRKVGWAVQKAHTQFPDPISEDGCWVSSVESSCCKSIPGFIRVATPFSDQSPLTRPKVVFLVGPEPAQYRGRRTLGRALNPAAYSGDSTGDRETDSKCL